MTNKKNSARTVVAPVLDKLQKISNNKKISTNKEELFGEAYYNCWGFTAFTYKWLPELDWFEMEEMEYCLGEFTTPVKSPRIGDIFVMREKSDGELLHTGILMDAKNKMVIHKPGGCSLEVNDLKGAQRIYGKHNITYRRAIPKKKFNYRQFTKSIYYGSCYNNNDF